MKPLIKDRKKHDIFVNKYKRLGINPNSKQFKRYYKAGLLSQIDESFVETVQNYWKKNYNKTIDPVFHIAFYNLTGIKEPRLIPSREMWNEIIPFLNDMNIRVGYSDKNIYDQLFNSKKSAETVLKHVRGNYFDRKNNQITIQDADQLLIDLKEDLIIKPSDTDNGKGVALIKYKEGYLYLNNKLINVRDLEMEYGFNFIIQKIIKQHPIMAKPHPSSVNTLRMVTLRWNNKIEYLLTFARFGMDGEIRDNAGMGGLCVGVKDSGEFFDFAIDEHCNVYKKHPTTNYSFNNLSQIPNFDNFKSFVINLHKNILHHDFISWDIAVGADGQPIFLEANFRGATWLYQMAAQKMFGDLTEDVLQNISSELNKNKFNRNVKAQLPLPFRAKNRRLKRQNRNLKTQNTKLRLRNKKLVLQNERKAEAIQKVKKDFQKIKREHQKILQSTSWKITAPLRKVGYVYKKIVGMIINK